MFPCSIRFFLLLVVFIVYHAQSFSYPSLCWSIFLALCFPFLEGLPLLSPIFFLIPHMFFFSVQIWKKQRQNRKTTKRRTGDFKLVHPLPPLFLFHGSFSLSFPCSTSTCLFLALTKSGLWNMPETILKHEGVAYTQHLPFLRLEEIRREQITRTVLWWKKRRTCWHTYSCYWKLFNGKREVVLGSQVLFLRAPFVARCSKLLLAIPDYATTVVHEVCSWRNISRKDFCINAWF